MHKYYFDSADLFAYKSNRGAKYASSETHESWEVSYKKRELSQMRHLIDWATKDERNEKNRRKNPNIFKEFYVEVIILIVEYIEKTEIQKNEIPWKETDWCMVHYRNDIFEQKRGNRTLRMFFLNYEKISLVF